MAHLQQQCEDYVELEMRDVSSIQGRQQLLHVFVTIDSTDDRLTQLLIRRISQFPYVEIASIQWHSNDRYQAIVQEVSLTLVVAQNFTFFHWSTFNGSF